MDRSQVTTPDASATAAILARLSKLEAQSARSSDALSERVSVTQRSNFESSEGLQRIQLIGTQQDERFRLTSRFQEAMFSSISRAEEEAQTGRVDVLTRRVAQLKEEIEQTPLASHFARETLKLALLCKSYTLDEADTVITFLTDQLAAFSSSAPLPDALSRLQRIIQAPASQTGRPLENYYHDLRDGFAFHLLSALMLSSKRIDKKESLLKDISSWKTSTEAFIKGYKLEKSWIKISSSTLRALMAERTDASSPQTPASTQQEQDYTLRIHDIIPIAYTLAAVNTATNTSNISERWKEDDGVRSAFRSLVGRLSDIETGRDRTLSYTRSSNAGLIDWMLTHLPASMQPQIQDSFWQAGRYYYGMGPSVQETRVVMGEEEILDQDFFFYPPRIDGRKNGRFIPANPRLYSTGTRLHPADP